ncbi:hypothetical protein FACS189451_11880 [Bacteroidia bacterium]|nr:hypothetical protein FACS189451_11880 [Bacteroidia bacterium]
MARMTDITIERNYRGAPAYIKFNYKKYGALLNSFFIEKGIDCPFLHIPNETTVKAMEEARQGKGKTFSSVDDLIADLYK